MTNLSKLAQAIINKFSQVQTAFRAFDLRTRGAVAFSDFAYAVDQLKLGFDRETLVQIFAFLDKDQDTLLKYRDFCSLCAQHASLQASPSQVISNESRGSQFSNIIKQIKGRTGRGGPKFNRRGTSARTYGVAQKGAQNVDEMLGET